jgi:hypothetical protein
VEEEGMVEGSTLGTCAHTRGHPPLLLFLQLLTLLMFARVWARVVELLLPIGFLLLLLSTVPQFVSFLFLVSYLDFPDDTSRPTMAVRASLHGTHDPPWQPMAFLLTAVVLRGLLEKGS